MKTTVFLGVGHYVPERVVTNDDLAARMDTSDAWITQRTGIRERRHVDFERQPMGSSDLGAKAGEAALAEAGVSPLDVDCIVYATLSSDRIFPGDGVLVQAKMGIPAGVPAFDIRNQCSGFLYGLELSRSLIATGNYQRVLLIGSEVHSSGLDWSDRGRDVTVLFGDGSAAAVLGPGDASCAGRGILSVRLHADGRFADALQLAYPSSAEMPRLSAERITSSADHFPQMDGRTVFRHAATRMPEVVLEVLQAGGYTPQQLDLLIPHQANLRISEMVQSRLGLTDDQVFNNIMHYGNTTAASIPLALSEAVQMGRIKKGDLICLVSFGAGFTWGAALLRW